VKYLRCPYCGATNQKSRSSCWRCDLPITLDRTRVVHKSLAYLLAAIIFYIPANIYPVLASAKFSQTQGSTILEGVFAMWRSGDYPVAIIIFTASILIPLLKFLILFYLIVSIKGCYAKGVRQRIRLYYLIEITGPWSLIDVFVVLILVALIHFKNIAIIPGVGVTSFALMVVLTIFSADALDPRVLGETCEE